MGVSDNVRLSTLWGKWGETDTYFLIISLSHINLVIFIIMWILNAVQFQMLTLYSCLCRNSAIHFFLWILIPTIVPLYSVSPPVREDHSSVKPDPIFSLTLRWVKCVGFILWACSGNLCVMAQWWRRHRGCSVQVLACGFDLDRQPSGLFQFDARANNRIREQACNTSLNTRPP